MFDLNFDLKKLLDEKFAEEESSEKALTTSSTAGNKPSAEKIEENSAFQNNSDSTAADVPVSNEESADVQADFDSEKDSADASKVEVPAARKDFDTTAADDVPVYTATAKEIHYWHACVNIHILDFLRTYDLDRQSLAFDSFRIGVDDEKHAITFSLDDTHYLKIDLNDTNVRPIDKEQAEKVLRKVNAMRFEKVKDHPFYRPRTW